MTLIAPTPPFAQAAQETLHIPVLREEFLRLGFPEHGKTFLDGTFGYGGHSRALLEAFPGITCLIGIDRDKEILDRNPWAASEDRLHLVHGNFSDMRAALRRAKLENVDGILLDLGVSSLQLDAAERGFSFQRSGPLDMRMNPGSGPSAADLVHNASEAELTRIFQEYGEERFSRQIAAHIARARRQQSITTTTDLAAIVVGAIPGKYRHQPGIHPATRVFQALRIAVNQELDELQAALPLALELLAPGGRLAVISFHSLEDRLVKEFFLKQSKTCVCPPKFPVCVCRVRPTLKVLTRKPVIAEESEIVRNPRSRSAKMRVAERLP
jgi:16S rRNA (cytosine1402-N4)-methyltransferase